MEPRRNRGDRLGELTWQGGRFLDRGSAESGRDQRGDIGGLVERVAREIQLRGRIGEDEMFVGSDVAAFIEHTRDAVELGQDQAVVVTASRAKPTTASRSPVTDGPPSLSL